MLGKGKLFTIVPNRLDLRSKPYKSCSQGELGEFTLLLAHALDVVPYLPGVFSPTRTSRYGPLIDIKNHALDMNPLTMDNYKPKKLRQRIFKLDIEQVTEVLPSGLGPKDLKWKIPPRLYQNGDGLP